METKECQYCCSEIPARAEKCKYCHEWQDEKESLIHIPLKNEFPVFNQRFAGARTPFHLSLVRKIPLNYMVSILIVVMIIFGAIQITWYRLGEERIYLMTFLVYSIQMMVSWAGLIWAYNLIGSNYPAFVQISSLPREEAEDKFIKAHNLMFNRTFAIIAGIVTGAVASVGEYILGTPFATEKARIVFAVFEFINMFFAGAAIYTILMFSFFLSRISTNPNKQALGLDKNNGVLGIGHLHLRTSVLAIVPLFLGVVARLFGDWQWLPLHYLWYGGFAVIIVIYFFWPLSNIHNLMVEYKEDQLTIIQKKIQRVVNDLASNQSARNFVKLNEYKSIEKSISSQNTWPFDTKSISAAFFAVILPVFLMIIEKIWSFRL